MKFSRQIQQVRTHADVNTCNLLTKETGDKNLEAEVKRLQEEVKKLQEDMKVLKGDP